MVAVHFVSHRVPRGISFAVSLLIPAAVFTAGVHGARPVRNVCRPGLF